MIATAYWRLFLGSIGSNVIIRPRVRFHQPRNVFIGDNVTISEDTLFGTESMSGKLHIGNGVQINRGCFLDHSGDVIVGENTLISEGSSVLSHSHGYDPRSTSVGIPKTIGRDCWIGYRVVITENARTIADNVIIATGSVVSKSCDSPGSIYGGIPAKWIKQIEERT